jgi:hypothetical protein
MKLVALNKVKALAEKQGVKFSNAEYTLLCMIDPAELPEASPGSKPGKFHYEFEDFKILLKSNADQSDLEGKVEICFCIIKKEEYKFLVVS